jgi:CRISPR-associated protein Cmr2
MNEWLMKIGLGGVQGFISEARKTNDLRVGSQIISEMAGAIASKAASDPRVKLLRPTTPNTAHCPHQVVLSLRESDQQKIKDFGEGLKQCVREKLLTRLDVNTLRAGLPSVVRDNMQSLDDAAIEAEVQQTIDGLEVYWVAVPVAGPAADASRQLSRMYDSRRHTRTFAPSAHYSSDQPPWVCSLCGNRVGRIQPKGKEKWPGNTVLKDREKLCALCLAKRMDKAQSIPSTHALARDRFFRCRQFDAIRGTFNDKDSWSRVLDQLDDMAEERHVSSRKEQQLQNKLANESRNRFGERATAAFALLTNEHLDAIAKLPSYYAIILYDGDRMGEWFSGARFTADTLSNSDKYNHAQADLSGQLMEFAKCVAAQAERFRSAAIYAGGDEGLILAPIDFVIPWIRYLDEQWKRVRDCSRQYAIDAAQTMSLSLHASFIHAKFPLQPAIRDVHRALGAAKNTAQRNCVSLRVSPRSGAAAQMILRWEELSHLEATVELFSNRMADDGEQKEPRRNGVRNPLEIGPTSLIYKALEAIDGFFNPETNQIHHSLTERLHAELMRVADSDDAVWHAGWEQTVDWLIQRLSKNSTDSPEQHERAAVENVFKVSGWLARQLDWGEVAK